jgi:hypothetical protein
MYAIIACGVFKHEIETISKELEFPFEVHYLGSGLHVDFDDLESALKSELEKCKDCEGIIVAYGECHPKIAEILAPYKAALIDCQNCVDAFITRKGVAEKSSKGLYFFLSPGWIECWREIFSSLNWTQEEARLQLGPFKGSIFLDTLGNSAEYENELLEFLDFTLLPYKVVPVDLCHFKSLILSAKKKLEE